MKTTPPINFPAHDPAVSIRLPADMLAQVDAAARVLGLGRSAVLRMAIKQGLGEVSEICAASQKRLRKPPAA